MKKLIEEIIPTLSFKFPYSLDDYAEHLYLENYHCHKDNSNWIIADSPEPIENYSKRVKEFGAKCLYSGEHGTQGNQFQVYKDAESNGLKYRHSTEAYWVKDRHEKDNANCHIVLVAKNPDGRKDINYMLSIANEDGYYYRPRIDLELLLSIPKDNLIVTSACVAGWNYDDADEIWLKIAEHFKGNFYFEVQYHNTDKQKELNKKILKLAKDNNIQIICGLDSHYISDEGKVKRNQILTYKNINYPEEEGWYMDYPDTVTVIDRFREQGVLTDKEILTAIMNTNVFVNECEDIVLDKSFKIPNLYKNKTYKERCDIYKKILNTAYKKEKLKSKAKEDGIRYEASQIMDSGVVDYCIISKAIIDEAINNYGGILTTTSRGSAASFVTNKLLGLTTVDRFNAEIPIYPERFLTKDRVDAGMMPDIDLNIVEQEPFVKAARKLLGEHGCYPLMAVEKLKEKAAWQLYAGANGVEPQVANTISTYIDAYNKALKHADDDMKDSIMIENFIPAEYLETYMQSRDYQGITINLKCHACGHLLLDGDIRREIGLISAVSETTGKRVICAAVEGGYLDEFGYVKEDFLIVDSVSLTHKFFERIDQPVPTFDELKEIVNGDKATWDVYANGITCCINQCENATEKVMKYKPQTVAELSAFIAAIRPGFASLLSTFLNRKEYSTGEKRIDELLEDTAHFALYQESLMKILSFLHLPMGETYGVIKSISKKKLKGEKKQHLMDQLSKAWLEEFGNMDNFNKVWDVIEDSAAYAFNSPHAYSMCGDSLYQAWFKAHHTKDFYEVAIEHYTLKNKKDKIDALVKEAIKHYGYKLGEYKFGDDNRKIHIDELKGIIYPNLSSIKGVGDSVPEELYIIGQQQFVSFIDVLTELKKHSINKSIIDMLIKINYFSDYGKVKYLLYVTKLYDLLYGAKTISKEKAEKNNIPFEFLRECGNETDKQFNKIDSSKLLNMMLNNVVDEDLSVKEILDNQREILGILSYKDDTISGKYLYVQSIESKSKLLNITLYEIKTGVLRNVKMWSGSYYKKSFEEGDILNITELDKKHKNEFTGQLDENGKRIYAPVPDQYEYWLKIYSISNNLGNIYM